MSSIIKGPKDFWTGVIYIAFGAVALWVGADYRMGTAGRMGPGYFPKVLAAILIVIGVIAIARSLMSRGEAIAAASWKPLVLISLACAAFGALLQPFGLAVALFALCIISAAASKEFRFDPKAMLGLMALIVFCALVFVKGLGVPMPIVGTLLEPFLGPLMPWLR